MVASPVPAHGRSLATAKASRGLQRENEGRLKDTAAELARATKCLTRSLQENVDLQGNVGKIHKIGHQVHSLLSITAVELMDVHMTSLEETTAQEHEVRTIMADTKKREKDLSASVAKLHSNLITLRLEMENEVQSKDQKIAEMRDKLVNQRHDVAIMLSYISHEGRYAHIISICL